MRGILNQKDLNIVQEQMLFAYTFFKQEQDYETEEAKFERDMLIANPQMYSEYMKKKQEDISNGNAGVTWMAPENDEEINELKKIFEDIGKQLKKDDLAADEEFIKQVNFMNSFNNIDINQLGEEE